MGEQIKKYLFNTGLIVICLILFASKGWSAATIDNPTASAAQLATKLQGPGVTITNPQFPAANIADRPEQYGIFSNGVAGANLSVETGIVLTTGSVTDALGPNNTNSASIGGFSAYLDPDVSTININAAFDPAIFEFDVTLGASSTGLQLVYQFGSEEYPDFVGSSFNDVFAFFVSGPGITGTINVAQAPLGGNVAIDTINYGVLGCLSDGTPTDLSQSAFYINNGHITNPAPPPPPPPPNQPGVCNTFPQPGPFPIVAQANGITTLLTAQLPGLTPGATYHFKMAIADVVDTALDSSVFIQSVFAVGLDYGDAPDTGAGVGTGNYETLAANNGPRHSVTPGLQIGTVPDTDTNGFSEGIDDNGNATDDDVQGSTDEGAITLGTITIADTSYSQTGIAVTNTMGGNATLFGWVDFDQNGSFDEDELASVTVANGATTANLTWSSLPGITAGTTYARFRIAAAADLTAGSDGGVDEASLGAADSGEVEDYEVMISATVPPPIPPALACATPLLLDFSLISAGAAGPDADFGFITGTAVRFADDGDPLAPLGFADGALNMSSAIPATYSDFEITFPYPVQIIFSQSVAHGWFDDSEDLIFTPGGGATLTVSDPGSESTFVGGSPGSPQPELQNITGNGTNTLSFGPTSSGGHVPVADSNWQIISTPTSSVRMQYTNLIGGNGTSFALTVCGADFGDAPGYAAASHSVQAGIHLGAEIDIDGGSYGDGVDNNSDASDDDSEGIADEDGVSAFPSLTVGDSTYTMPSGNIAATGTGTLHGWIDFNDDGSFDATEHTSVTVTAGVLSGNMVWSSLPTMIAGTTYARFRLTSDAGVTSATPASVATDGEVEDYTLTITNSSISGTIFDDAQYGGGSGRTYATADAAWTSSEVGSATVELYDNAGAYVSNTTTAVDGTYSFTGLADGTYYVRVVNASVSSTRSGGTGVELGVQTFRSDGTTDTTNEIGGRVPSVADAVANTGAETLNTGTFILSTSGQTLSVEDVTIAGSAVTGVDFGFNFDTIVNTNNAGQGSLRQFIDNSNLLTNAGLTQSGLTAGTETSIFEMPTSDTNHSAGVWTATPLTSLPTISDGFTAIDGTTQAGANCTSRSLAVAIDGSSLSSSSYALQIDAGDATVRGLSIGGLPGAVNNPGIAVDLIDEADRATFLCNHLGINVAGTARFSASQLMSGIALRGTGVRDLVVGNGSVAGRNLIGGNNHGIEAYPTIGIGGGDITIRGNYFGVGWNGTTNIAIGIADDNYGVFLREADNVQIGGPSAGDRNVFGYNESVGALIAFLGVNNSVIENNYMGIGANGTTNIGCRTGVNFDRSSVGGLTASDTIVIRDNIIGNCHGGILLQGSGAPSANIDVVGNHIGFGATGAAAPNSLGGIIIRDVNGVNIGDGTAAGRNVIGNTVAAIYYQNYIAENTIIDNNYIGVAPNGSTPAPSLYGIYIPRLGPGGNLITNTVIANSTSDGVLILSVVTGAKLSQNSIYNNGSLGIDLNNDDVTLNDAGDGDTGANDLLNFPVLSAALLAGGNLTVTGCAPVGSTIELFEADVSPTSTSGASVGDNKFGTSQDYGEGEIYLATMVEGVSDGDSTACTLPVDVDGNNQTGLNGFSFTIAAPAGVAVNDLLTMTATVSSSGTSEFSPVVPLTISVADLTITKDDGSTTYTPGGTATYVLTITNNGPSDVTGTAIVDNLPNGVTLSGAWTCSATASSSCSAASGGSVGDSSVSLTADIINSGVVTVNVPVQFSSDMSDY